MASSFSVDCTPEQHALLTQYATLLREWNPKINLVAPATLAQLETRHIDDSAQIVPHIPQGTQTVLDVGAGAGLPGLVVAILRPDLKLTLAERDQRKSAFLLTASHQLKLSNVTVHNADVNLIKNQYDVITCRAWAELKTIIKSTTPLLTPGGCWLLLKGQAFPEEAKACETLFHLTTETWPSIVPGNGWVVKVTPSE